jgi:4'-phosphopantetheinyl transferase
MTILPITSNEIHLWLVDYETVGDERLHAAYRAMLNPAEKAQQTRFYFERDRLRYLVTRALVRTVLSRYAPAVDPAGWIFPTNAYGCPAIGNPQAGDLTFNLSHTHSLIVLAVSRGRALGVDVENVVAREVSIDIADRYFAPPEVAALNAVPPHAQQDRFFEYWTFKESYIKARGMGLSLPLDQFSFHFPGDRGVELSIDPELRDDPARWQLWQFRPSPAYLVALCAQRVGTESPAVTLRQTIPMQYEEPLPLEPLRMS